MATEVPYTGARLSVHRDAVRLPDGRTGSYEHITVHDTVRVAAFDGDGRVMLVEDDFYLQQCRVLHLPGRSTDGQNPPAARREPQGPHACSCAFATSSETARTPSLIASPDRPRSFEDKSQNRADCAGRVMVWSVQRYARLRAVDGALIIGRRTSCG